MNNNSTSAAPAPEGGAVSPLVRRLAYGYAIMHQAICHMAGTSGASGRWYYDKANEAFGRVSPIHAITESSNPHVNGDYFSGMSGFLAALATREEAPAEAGELASQIAILRKAANSPTPDEDAGLTPESALKSAQAWRAIASNVVAAFDRAQPQAREYAQPVAWKVSHENDLRDHVYTDQERVLALSEAGWDVQPLYTRPVPDALREAREAVLSIKDAADSFRDCSGDEVAGQVIIRCDQALATLQAEQKGGA